MNSRSAWFWAFTAASMLLVLIGYEELFRRPPVGPVHLLPGFRAEEVQSVQVRPSGGPEISAIRTNGTWKLTRPLSYPAQTNAIEALLSALEAAVPATTIVEADLKQGGTDGSLYGLDQPRTSIVLATDRGRQQLRIGAKTAPGDQVFVQVVGAGGVNVVDADLLELVPTSANVWRDTGLFDLGDNSYDSIVVTTERGVLGLERAGADGAWRIVQPMTARADGPRLASHIQGLRDLSVRRFISDDPRADRVAFGLQPPELEIRFAKGTNTVRTLRFGRPVDAAAGLVYALGRDPSAVVAVPSAPLDAWQASPNEFRDRQLVRVPRDVSLIEVSNNETFSLVKATNGVWRVEPLGMPADPGTVRRFLNDLEALRVKRFVKDVVAGPDLPAYGLATPKLRVLLSSGTDSDPASKRVVGLEFGSTEGESVFVRRVDENAVYALDLAFLEKLPAAAGHFRQLKIWDFDEEQVAAVSLQKGNRTWRLVRNGLNQWSLAPGSEGIVNAFAVEEAVHRLGQLRAIIWTDWGQQNVARYGLDEDSITLTVELKAGGRRSVQFGFPAPSGHRYAGTQLDGGFWVFEFPGDTFDLVQSFLINPANLH